MAASPADLVSFLSWKAQKHSILSSQSPKQDRRSSGSLLPHHPVTSRLSTRLYHAGPGPDFPTSHDQVAFPTCLSAAALCLFPPPRGSPQGLSGLTRLPRILPVFWEHNGLHMAHSWGGQSRLCRLSRKRKRATSGGLGLIAAPPSAVGMHGVSRGESVACQSVHCLLFPRSVLFPSLHLSQSFAVGPGVFVLTEEASSDLRKG